MLIAQLAPFALIAAMTLPLCQQRAPEEVDLMARELARREHVVWQAICDRDIETIDRFLAEDFIYATSGAICFSFTKADVLEYLDCEPDEGVFEVGVRG